MANYYLPLHIALTLLAFPGLCFSQEDPKPFKLAVAQMSVVGGEMETNLAHAGEMIAEAAEHGARIVLLPEAMDLGWTHPSALTRAEPVPEGKVASFLSNAAREHGVYVCAGLTEKDGETVYNAAVLINPKGELVLLHRKINELDIGHPYYALGRRLSVCQTDLGAIGVKLWREGRGRFIVMSARLRSSKSRRPSPICL